MGQNPRDVIAKSGRSRSRGPSGSISSTRSLTRDSSGHAGLGTSRRSGRRGAWVPVSSTRMTEGGDEFDGGGQGKAALTERGTQGVPIRRPWGPVEAPRMSVTAMRRHESISFPLLNPPPAAWGGGQTRESTAADRPPPGRLTCHAVSLWGPRSVVGSFVRQEAEAKQGRVTNAGLARGRRRARIMGAINGQGELPCLSSPKS